VSYQSSVYSINCCSKALIKLVRFIIAITKSLSFHYLFIILSIRINILTASVSPWSVCIIGCGHSIFNSVAKPLGLISRVISSLFLNLVYPLKAIIEDPPCDPFPFLLTNNGTPHFVI
jgi:hypothetical protein